MPSVWMAFFTQIGEQHAKNMTSHRHLASS